MGEKALNTIEYMDRLVEAGVPEKQAKAQVLILYDIIGSSLASKRDIAELKRDIVDVRKDIEQLRADTKSDIEQLRADTARDIEKMGYQLKLWMGQMGLVFLGILLTAAKLGWLSIK